MPFTSASLLPVFVIGAYFYGAGELNVSWGLFGLTILGILIAHLGINVFNDYFDVKDGTDEANHEYFQQVSGGSRAIELGLISLKGTWQLGIILTLSALAIGVIIITSINSANINGAIQMAIAGLLPVSYTHLTLPTIYSV